MEKSVGFHYVSKENRHK